MLPEGRAPEPRNWIDSRLQLVTPGYLEMMRAARRALRRQDGLPGQARAFESLLFGVTARHPLTLAAVVALLLLVGLLASGVAARRAAPAQKSQRIPSRIARGGWTAEVAR